MSPPPKLSRRTIALGAMAAGVAALGGALYELPKFLKRRAHGEYASLVNRLSDPDAAATLGHAAAGEISAETAAADLKARLKTGTLAELAAADSADPDRIVEVEGWVLPFSIAEISVLAAQAM